MDGLHVITNEVLLGSYVICFFYALNVICRTSTISQNADCEMPRVYSELEDPLNNKINECNNLNAISCSENSSMEDLANHFEQGT